MAKKHSSEAFYALDDPLEAAVFSVLVEMLKEMAKPIAKMVRMRSNVSHFLIKKLPYFQNLVSLISRKPRCGLHPDSRQLVKQRYLKQPPFRTDLEIYSPKLNEVSSGYTPSHKPPYVL